MEHTSNPRGAGEYISRDAVRKAIRDCECPFAADYALDVTAWYVSEVDAVPAADVAPVVHGEWITDDDGKVACSICGRYLTWPINDSPFCHCGARMDKEATT